MRIGDRRQETGEGESGRVGEWESGGQGDKGTRQGDATRRQGDVFNHSLKLPVTPSPPRPLTPSPHLLFLLASSFWLLASSFSTPLTAKSSSCSAQDIKTLTTELLQDLPGYANRVSQRTRRLKRENDVYTYIVLAGRPEFEPLTLGPGVYTPTQPTAAPQQVFFTTLERQYNNGLAIELQQFHWVFLTRTPGGWRLATMFSRIGGYPAQKPPTPPQETSNGIVAQGISAWLRDCQARSERD